MKIACKIMIATMICQASIIAIAETASLDSFDLSSTTIDGKTILYDKCFEDKLPVFKQKYKQFFAEKPIAGKLQPHKQAIAEDINKILGINEPASEKQLAMFDAFAGTATYESVATIYLLEKETIKNILRSGKQLPNFTYDKQTDTATYYTMFSVSSKDKPDSKPTEICLPLSTDNFDEEIVNYFKAITSTQSVSQDIAIHELAEASLISGKLRTNAPYIRWFTDGTANVITIKILEKYIGPDAAAEFEDSYNTDRYAGIKNEINLQYWLTMRYCMGLNSPLEKENELDHARYSFATHEMQRLVNVHGIECIAKIVSEISNSKNRTNSVILKAIKTVTGEDLQPRMLAYQTFETREDGMKKYTFIAKKAEQDGNIEEAAIALMRVMEMYDSPFNLESLQARMQISLMLQKMGHTDLADKAMNNCVEFLKATKDQTGGEIANTLFTLYALQTDRPEIAADHAEKLLETRPDTLEALCVIMMNTAKQGNLTKAKEFAKKITDQKKTNSPIHKIAEQILSVKPLDKDKPKTINLSNPAK